MSVTTDSAIEKAVLVVTKLEGRDNWPLWSAMICIALGQTWAYASSDQVTPPGDTKDPRYSAWYTEDHNAHWRIFLALSDNVKWTVLLHIDSSASTLFLTLKSQSEASGISAEFYVKQNYKSTKLSDYNMIGDYITALTNLAHTFNKEIKGTIGCIEE